MAMHPLNLDDLKRAASPFTSTTPGSTAKGRNVGGARREMIEDLICRMHKSCNQRQPEPELLEELVEDAMVFWERIPNHRLREVCKAAMLRGSGFAPSVVEVAKAYLDLQHEYADRPWTHGQGTQNALPSPDSAPGHPDEWKAFLSELYAKHPHLRPAQSEIP